MSQTVFLSTVSNEFGTLRRRLASLGQRTKKHHFRQQDDFFHRGVKTLQKLVEEIDQSTIVLHIIGDQAGWLVPADQANALLDQRPEFEKRFPEVAAQARRGELPATQWEAWLGLLLGKRLLSFQLQSPACDPFQKTHVERLNALAEHPQVSEDVDALYDEMIGSLIAIGILTQADAHFPNNLPYRTLGELFIGREKFTSRTLNPCPFRYGEPPLWASGFGQDEFGYYAEFSLPTGDNYWDRVTQRMRWIPPGAFMMGSPETELERRNDETLHEVIISRGYWLAETVCTQRLWRAVMEDNPSRCQGDERPVENVSYADVESFVTKLDELLPSSRFSMPSEAQWEYACRAGTSTPFSFGETISTDQANFDGNFPYGDAPREQYRSETVVVKSLPPNAWGLYEMHGNVSEWCFAWYGEYSKERQMDPTGSKSGSLRVFRSGSWNHHARIVRSACRNAIHPGDRYDHLGFRLLSSA
jgi:formylglycine-generating enzyme required for sulfatase activity